jgi:hypothetical protein
LTDTNFFSPNAQQVAGLVTLPSNLIKLLESPFFVKIGRNCKADITRLNNDFNLSLPRSNLVDLFQLSQECCMSIPGQGSLAQLTATLLGEHLDKTLACSAWDEPLSPAMLEYAALDAFIALPLYRKIKAEKTYNVCFTDTSAPGAADREMSGCHFNLRTSPTGRIHAEGVLLGQPGVGSFVEVGSGERVKMSRHRRLVRITKVLAPAFKIFHSSSDKRPLESFGPVPFQALVLISQLYTCPPSTNLADEPLNSLETGSSTSAADAKHRVDELEHTTEIADGLVAEAEERESELFLP